MKNFLVAKFVIYMTALIGWSLVFVAAFIFFPIFLGNGNSSGIWTGAVALTGLIVVAFSQMGLAQISTAENTHEANELLKELIRQKNVEAVSLGGFSASSQVGASPSVTPPEPPIKRE